MEKKVRKKRPSGTSTSKEGKDNSAAKARSQQPVKKSTPAAQVQTPPTTKVLNIPLNPETARQAVILSEIIGKPVSKRGRR